jgi:hypothetical protein
MVERSIKLCPTPEAQMLKMKVVAMKAGYKGAALSLHTAPLRRVQEIPTNHSLTVGRADSTTPSQAGGTGASNASRARAAAGPASTPRRPAQQAPKKPAGRLGFATDGTDGGETGAGPGLGSLARPAAGSRLSVMSSSGAVRRRADPRGLQEEGLLRDPVRAQGLQGRQGPEEGLPQVR